MHELGLAENLCTSITEYAENRVVTRIVVGLGAFSGVNRDAFEFCFEAVTRENLGGAAEIILEHIPGRAKCKCGEEYETDDLLSSCPKCGGFVRDIIDGKDLILKSIEVD